MLLIVFACKSDKQSSVNFEADLFHKCSKALDKAVINDFFSPPVAIRIYTYSNIAAYEVLATNDTALIPLAGQVHELNRLRPADDDVNIELACMWAYTAVGKSLVYSEYFLDTLRTELISEAMNAGLTDEQVKRSTAYGDECSKQILEWISEDNYKQMRSWDIWTPSDSAGAWIPTPPDYFDAMEPHWPKLRTLVIDSASQFRPEPPTKFSLKPGSAFFEENMEVYNSMMSNDSDRVIQARYWDDAPFQPKVQGHTMAGEKKLTPPGHWLNISRGACITTGKNFKESVEALTMISIAMFDGVISCWDAKYFYNYIRPVTVLQIIKDPLWIPILYTPNFPEYTSGHSVFSGSGSTIAEHYFPEYKNFKDSSEVQFGLPVRSFETFADAADEAAMSRLYGGIHFMPSIKNGVEQGRQVGRFILANIKTQP